MSPKPMVVSVTTEVEGVEVQLLLPDGKDGSRAGNVGEDHEGDDAEGTLQPSTCCPTSSRLLMMELESRPDPSSVTDVLLSMA